MTAIVGYLRGMIDGPAWAHDVVHQQLAMNQRTWAALQEHGVDDSTQLRLEFFYVAPGRTEAETLGGFLRNETDYLVDVHAMRSGIFKKQWSVTGSTQPMLVSLGRLASGSLDGRRRGRAGRLRVRRMGR